jgi:hypothetical protein
VTIERNSRLSEIEDGAFWTFAPFSSICLPADLSVIGYFLSVIQDWFMFRLRRGMNISRLMSISFWIANPRRLCCILGLNWKL